MIQPSCPRDVIDELPHVDLRDDGEPEDRGDDDGRNIGNGPVTPAGGSEDRPRGSRHLGSETELEESRSDRVRQPVVKPRILLQGVKECRAVDPGDQHMKEDECSEHIDAGAELKQPANLGDFSRTRLRPLLRI